MELREITLKLEIWRQVMDIKSRNDDLIVGNGETIAWSGENDTLTK